MIKFSYENRLILLEIILEFDFNTKIHLKNRTEKNLFFICELSLLLLYIKRIKEQEKHETIYKLELNKKNNGKDFRELIFFFIKRFNIIYIYV